MCSHFCALGIWTGPVGTVDSCMRSRMSGVDWRSLHGQGVAGAAQPGHLFGDLLLAASWVLWFSSRREGPPHRAPSWASLGFLTTWRPQNVSSSYIVSDVLRGSRSCGSFERLGQVLQSHCTTCCISKASQIQGEGKETPPLVSDAARVSHGGEGNRWWPSLETGSPTKESG